MNDADPIDDDTEIDIRLRAPREVAERTLLLGAVCRRAFLEGGAESLAGDDPEAERFDLTAWLREEGLDPSATPGERALLHARVGRLPADEATAATWRSEAFVALGWSLGLLDVMPAYDVPVDPAPLLAAIPTAWATTKAFRASAILRDEETIARERERAELWYWRAETAELLSEMDEPDRAATAAAIREVTRDAHNLGLLPRVLANDFSARGLPYRALAPAVVADLAAIAGERLRALNWLCGFGASWDDVPLDV